MAEIKSLDSPDEVRPFEGKGQLQLVQIGGKNVGRATFEPGWRWSENVKPIAGTDSCQVHHLGYCVAGSMKIHMDDGEEVELSAGDAYDIPPGHDAEVVGDENCVMLDVAEDEGYAKPE